MVATEVVTESRSIYIILPGRVNSRYEITDPIEVTWGPLARVNGESNGWLYMEFRFNQDRQERPQIEPIRTFARDFETMLVKMEQMLASTRELVHLMGLRLAITTDPVLSIIARDLQSIKPLYEVSAPSVNGHH